ncbi:MAG TPA: type II toxin-antitoxin system Phd/YefM family antitoxin [Gemmatimonadaceae bacterium]|nr:type II toxin-antitoxin system Phd/YefM family antitoxin [Gemmatimonadaceae bacterium]
MAEKVPNVWTLQDAKNRFSEVVRDAVEVGPQTITRHGVVTVVIMSASDYERDRKPFRSLYDALRPPGFVGVDLDIERDRSPMREIDFSEE